MHGPRSPSGGLGALRGRALLLLLLSFLGCRLRPEPRRLPPLLGEGEVHVYLDPLPRAASRLRITLAEIAAIPAEGAAHALELRLPVVSATTAADARLLAFARLPPGAYEGLQLRFSRVALGTEDGVADLLIDAEPLRLPAEFAIERRKGAVLCVAFEPGDHLRGGIAFAPTFRVLRPEPVVTAALGVASNTRGQSLTLFDRRTRRVVAVAPTGQGPRGAAIDERGRRVYVALEDEDAIEVLDLGTLEPLERISLRPGDRPIELALVQGSLLSLNAGSSSLSFLEPQAGVESARVGIGLAPRALAIEPSGRRAYVFDAESNEITIVDLGARRVAGGVSTEASPLRGRFSRDGSRLHVAHAASPFMLVLSVPALTTIERVFVGGGMRSLGVHAATDRVFVGMDDGTLQVFEPNTFLPVETIPVPAPVTEIDVDEAENTLVLLMPDRDAVGFLGLGDRRMLSTIDVGLGPRFVALP